MTAADQEEARSLVALKRRLRLALALIPPGKGADVSVTTSAEEMLALLDYVEKAKAYADAAHRAACAARDQMALFIATVFCAFAAGYLLATIIGRI